MVRPFPRESNLCLKVEGRGDERCGESRVGAVGMRSCASGVACGRGRDALLRVRRRVSGSRSSPLCLFPLSCALVHVLRRCNAGRAGIFQRRREDVAPSKEAKAGAFAYEAKRDRARTFANFSWEISVAWPRSRPLPRSQRKSPRPKSFSAPG
jgi:hypothetical protein